MDIINPNTPLNPESGHQDNGLALTSANKKIEKRAQYVEKIKRIKTVTTDEINNWENKRREKKVSAGSDKKGMKRSNRWEEKKKDDGIRT
jgi:hypothetical protein